MGLSHAACCAGSPTFNKQLMPHADVHIVPGTGHVCIFGPDEGTRKHIVAGIASMPLLPANAATQDEGP